jgi:Ku70/Ku80 C-terminal arm
MTNSATNSQYAVSFLEKEPSPKSSLWYRMYINLIQPSTVEKGQVVDPAGFNAIILPYVQDIRSVDHGDPSPVPDHLIQSMSAMIDKLKMEHVPVYSNPVIDNLEINVRALALDVEEPEELVDTTVPDADFVKTADEMMTEFMEMTLTRAPKHDAEDEPETSTTVKRAKVVDESIFEVETIRDRVANGSISKYTIDQLKTVLKNAKVKVTGKKKAELVQQVLDTYA